MIFAPLLKGVAPFDWVKAGLGGVQQSIDPNKIVDNVQDN